MKHLNGMKLLLIMSREFLAMVDVVIKLYQEEVPNGNLRSTSKLQALIIATLALGLRPRQRGCKVVSQEDARESHHMLPGV
jgi:hypothetical protein